MSDFEGKLEQILGDPKAMEQIMSLARSLGGSNGSSSQQPADQSGQSGGTNTAQAAETASASSLLDGLGQLDPRMLSGIAHLIGQYQSNDDERVALLNALRPFVKEQRYAKVDKAIQIAKLSRLIRMAIELFRARGDDHV